jgi:hypothetical protein
MASSSPSCVSVNNLVDRNWDGITRVAEALTAEKLLDGAAVKTLLFPDKAEQA